MTSWRIAYSDSAIQLKYWWPSSWREIIPLSRSSLKTWFTLPWSSNTTIDIAPSTIVSVIRLPLFRWGQSVDPCKWHIIISWGLTLVCSCRHIRLIFLLEVAAASTKVAISPCLNIFGTKIIFKKIPTKALRSHRYPTALSLAGNYLATRALPPPYQKTRRPDIKAISLKLRISPFHWLIHAL